MFYVSTDIDECTEGSDTCNDDTTCVNTPGSFRCDGMREGYHPVTIL